MSETDQELGEDALQGNGAVAEPGSMLDQLRQTHRALLDSQERYMPIPGYKGMLYAKYRLLDVRNDMRKIGKRVQKQFRGNEQDQIFWSNVDAMIEACEGLYYQQDDETYLSISDALGSGDKDQPITYSDPRLIEFFAWDPDEFKGARDVVIRLFNNDAALLEHGRALGNWMRDTSKDVDEDFLTGLR